MPHPLPANAQLQQFKQAAKQLLRAFEENPEDVREQIEREFTLDPDRDFKLANAQFVVARRYGFESWARLKTHLESKPLPEKMIDAAAQGATELVELLLRDDENLIDAVGGWQQFRPLFFAERGGHDETATILRHHGATLDVFEASAVGSVPELQRIMNESPEAANARRDHYDATPLHCVRGAGVEAARYLIDCGADVNATDSQDLTPLHGRAEHGDVEMVKLLIQSGAKLHAESCMGTPLHAAVGGFQHKPPKLWQQVAELLREHGADLNFRSHCGVTGDWTPLHHAAWRDHLAAVQWLLKVGADRTIVNQHVHTAEQTANEFQHKEIVDLLAEAQS